MILNNEEGNKKVYYLIKEHDYSLTLNIENNNLFIKRNNYMYYTDNLHPERSIFSVDNFYYLYKTIYSFRLTKFDSKSYIVLKSTGILVDYEKFIRHRNNNIEMFLHDYSTPLRYFVSRGIVNFPLIFFPNKYIDEYENNLNKILKELICQK